MQRFTRSKVYLRIMSGNPSTTLNHYKHYITSATQRAIGAAWRHRELGDLRNVVREDSAAEHSV